MDKYLPEGFTYTNDETTEPSTDTVEQEIKQDDKYLPEGFTYATKEELKVSTKETILLHHQSLSSFAILSFDHDW